MTIQIPNPGTGNGASGDNEFVLWSKVKDNFSDQTNAASRLVGNNNGNLAEMSSSGVAGTGWGAQLLTQMTNVGTVPAELKSGVYVLNDSSTKRPPTLGQFDNLVIVAKRHTVTTGAAIWLPYGYGSTGTITVEAFSGTDRTYFNIYTDRNTTKDVATGFLKASSPVLHVYNDSITKIHEAEQLDITVDKKDVGHYEIHGTTGLRKNDGWFMSPPRDMHSNVLCMVDYEEKDGVIILKTYKKKFDFETVSIVHDYDNPMDIPEGACVEFRFNDLPREQLDEPIE